jgi:hypothetical protein
MVKWSDGWEGAWDIKNYNVGNNEFWMVNVHHEVYRRTGLDQEAAPWGTGTDWDQVPGEMIYVATAEEGIVWGIDTDGEVWRWLEGEISIEEIVDNTEHHWIHVPEK